MRRLLFAASFILVACQHDRRQENVEELKKRVQELTAEITKLRGEIVRVRIENLEIRLKEARRTANAKEELRILLEDGIGSEFLEIKRYAFRALVAVAPDRRKEAVSVVLDKWKTADEIFKVEALPFLAQVTDDARAVETVIAATRDASPGVRKAAASVLKTVSTEAGVTALLEMLKDPQKEVKLAAVDALGVAKRDAAVEPLRRFVSEEKDVELIEKGVDALGNIGNAEALPTILDLLGRAPESVTWSCINSLGKIGDPRAIEKIRPFLESNHSRQIREVAISTLGKLKDTDSLPAFEKILQEDAEPRLREVAAASIRRVGDVSALERSLLPAYFSEKTESVRKAIWEHVLKLCGENFDALEKVALMLLDKRLNVELEEVGAKLHAITPVAANRDRYVALEERVAATTFEAKAYREALGHYKNLVKNVPENWEGHRRVAQCYLELGDAEGALKTLQEQIGKVPRGETIFWTFKEDILGALSKLGDPARTLDETYGLLHANPLKPPDELRKTAEKMRVEAGAALVKKLGSADEATRKAAIDAARGLGKKGILILADALENAEAKDAHPAIIEAGNAITGTKLDTATSDAAKLKEAAAAWRAWAEKNP